MNVSSKDYSDDYGGGLLDRMERGELEEKVDGVASEALEGDDQEPKREFSWSSALFSVGLVVAAVTVVAVIVSIAVPYFMSIAATGGVTAIAFPIATGAVAAIIGGTILSPFLFVPNPEVD